MPSSEADAISEGTFRGWVQLGSKRDDNPSRAGSTPVIRTKRCSDTARSASHAGRRAPDIGFFLGVGQWQATWFGTRVSWRFESSHLDRLLFRGHNSERHISLVQW